MEASATNAEEANLRLLVEAKTAELGYRPGEMIDDFMAVAEAVATQCASELERAVTSHDLMRGWVWRLVEAIDDLSLWEPGRKGYAQALSRLRAERDWAALETTPLGDTDPSPR